MNQILVRVGAGIMLILIGISMIPVIVLGAMVLHERHLHQQTQPASHFAEPQLRLAPAGPDRKRESGAVVVSVGGHIASEPKYERLP